MTNPNVTFVSSRSNPQLMALRRLAQSNAEYRKSGRIWLEGDHLCRAALARGVKPQLAVFAASFWPTAPRQWSEHADAIIVLDDALWRDLSALESPAKMGYVIALPLAPDVQPGLASVVLDRVQDAGNVGSILRSASAFGFQQVIALKGTAGLWSPKVVRSGMGAHFGLNLIEGAEVADLDGLGLPLFVTSSHQGDYLHQSAFPKPSAWAFGHEGQGVCDELSRRASGFIRIAQPGGEESLNVAAAAAICLHSNACPVR